MGRLPYRCSINAKKFSVWIIGDDLADHAFADKQCLDTASGPAKLAKAGSVSAVILADNDLSYGVVGIGVCGNRLVARERLGKGTQLRFVNWCVCDKPDGNRRDPRYRPDQLTGFSPRQ
jgi:hypothetical protein